jgi:hypothetical protein
MTYQAIRRFYEQPVETVAAALGIPVRYDNQLESGGDAYSEYITARLNPGTTSDPTLCGPIEIIRGSYVVEYYGPKGIGSGRAQDVMQQIASALCLQVETRPHDVAGFIVNGDILALNGPTFTPLNNTPYYFSSLSASIIGRIVSPGAPVAAVNSLHTRVGDVVSEEGDYSVGMMGDVDTTTNPPAPGELMDWNGTNWVPTPSIDSEDY